MLYPLCCKEWEREESRWRSRQRKPDLLDSEMHENEGEGNLGGAGGIKGIN